MTTKLQLEDEPLKQERNEDKNERKKNNKLQIK